MSPAFCPAETRDRVRIITYVSRYNYVSWVLASCWRKCAFPDYVGLGFHCLLQQSLQFLEGIPNTALRTVTMAVGIPWLPYAVC